MRKMGKEINKDEIKIPNRNKNVKIEI